ncbi:MAG: ATP-binding protein [Halobacteria archaeon]|nr:ATP-binding protein [Halobacteria archaeon]
MFYEGYLDIVPVARDTVVERINNGVIVVDEVDKIVDINGSAQQIFGLESESENDVVGTKLSDALEGDDETGIVDLYAEIVSSEDENKQREFSIELDGEKRYFQFEVTPLREGDERVGSVLMFNDITEQRQREERIRRRESELEKQNERLDEFASIVSHDLRNPLNVAQGYAEMVNGEVEADISEIDEIQDALGRMENIIDDSLTLAREGYEVIQEEEVNLGDVAHDAWDNVEKEDANLTVDTDVAITADRNKLLNVFENLYRNAIEHGGDDVSIKVGLLEDDGENDTLNANGLYIEDDGEGISEDEREDVFEQGYTTSNEGTGLGLAIVETIAEAHGWDVSVGESDEGGARFEITGTGTGTGTGLEKDGKRNEFPIREREDRKR